MVPKKSKNYRRDTFQQLLKLQLSRSPNKKQSTRSINKVVNETSNSVRSKVETPTKTDLAKVEKSRDNGSSK